MRAQVQPGEHDRAAGSPTGLRVRLFGGLALHLGDQSLVLESARARSLLGYLLLHGDVAHRREHVSFLLWPDSTEAQARTNLRKIVHTLRREHPQLAGFLDVTPRTLRWRRDDPQWLDVEEFQSALATAATSAGADEEATVLRRAVELYVGDLLDGCYDEWLVPERERFRDRYAFALGRLAVLLSDGGDHTEAIRLTRELLRCEPLREATYRQLMALHDAAGDRAAAVRVYHECAGTLQRELGVDPSLQTTDLYNALTRLEQPIVELETRVARVGAASLVGREREWARLTHAWRETESGRSQLVLVAGEAGIGKTRLVEDLAGWCGHRGALLAQAGSYPNEGELGYGVLIAWLRARDVADHLRAAPPADLAALARLLPELHDGTSSSLTLDEAEQRRRLFAAAAGALTASGRPTLLIVDDAQWCDAQSLALVHFLLRGEPGSPVLVVATVRREELEDDHPLSGVVDGLRRIDRASEIALGRLTRDDTGELAGDLAFDAAGVDQLYSQSEGNPLFIVETIRAAREGAVAGTLLSPKLHAVITARLRQCSNDAASVLGTAATVGRAFTTDLVRVASGADDLTFVRALDELWRRGLIREHGADGYDFSHGKIRDVAYDALSPATRRRNHLLVADALQLLHAGDLDAVSGQIAVNYDRGGRVPDAVAWYGRAAVQAQRRHADVEAVRLLDRARTLVPGLPADVRLTTELRIVSALPTALVGVDGFESDRVDEAQRRAVELARAIGAELDPPLLRSLVMSRLCRHDFDGARAAAVQLRGAAEAAGDDGLFIESAYLLGIAAFWTCHLESAREHFEQVIQRFPGERRHDHVLRFGHDPEVVCVSRLANTLWFLGDPDGARRARDDAVALAIETGHPYSRAAAFGFGTLVSIDLGDITDVRACVDGLAREEHHARPTGVFAEAFAGYIDVLDGRTGTGMSRIRAAIDGCGPVDPAPGLHACFRRVLLAAHDAGGDPAGGLAAADEALRLGGSRLWEPEIRRLRAEFLAATGGPADEVAAELGRAADVADSRGALGQARRITESRSRLRVAG